MTTCKMAVLVDLDGTLCNTRHRKHIIANRAAPPWLDYSMACHGDAIVPGVAAIVAHLGLTHDIILCSGRSDLARERTVKWLDDHKVVYDELLLRNEGDMRHNAEFKGGCVRYLRGLGLNIVLAIDDYAPVAKEYAVLGIPTLLVARDGVQGHSHVESAGEK